MPRPGVSPGEGTGATMSDDEEDQIDSDAIMFDGCLEGHDATGFGPLIPTESEKSLMERVRHELKHELKNVRPLSISLSMMSQVGWEGEQITFYKGVETFLYQMRFKALRENPKGKVGKV